MQIKRRDGSDERRILTAMIVDKTVLARVASKWDPRDGLFRSEWANTVAGWCVDYWDRYLRAPKQHVEGLYEAWAEDHPNEDAVALVGRFLGHLSDEWEQASDGVNADYITDLAGRHFNRVRLERLSDAIQGHVDGGDLERAEKLVATWGRMEMGSGAGVDVLNNEEAVLHAFAAKSDPLVEYPGALGKFFGDALERDALVAFMGPEKRGKTWWLMDVAWQAMRQHRRVAFFEVGDLSQAQIMRRFMVRAARRPTRSGTYLIPTGVEIDTDTGQCEVLTKERTWDDPLDGPTAWAACQQAMRKDVRAKEGLLRLSTHPNDSISVAGVRSIIQGWDRQGWTPDVVVVDYADILATPAGTAESRDQINATWKQLRALSQQYHCLVVTATQADAASYAAETMRRWNFSEDKRKLAHVTGMVGLNATEEEKERGLMRLNWIVLRESEYSESKCVHVAGCLPLARPAIYSTF